MAVEAVFEKIENSIDSEIEISNDYYLTIPMDEAIDVANDVKPAVGSLFDDWENPDRLVNKLQPATFVNLDRLAAILRAISQEMIRQRGHNYRPRDCLMFTHSSDCKRD